MMDLSCGNSESNPESVGLHAAQKLLGLAGLVGGQLEALCACAKLPSDQGSALKTAFKLLTPESLDQDIATEYKGLSYINADGFPFQWVIRTSQRTTNFGFLCEVGTPGEPLERRCSLSLARVLSVSTRSQQELSWLARVAQILLPAVHEGMPPHWRSAIWIGTAPAPDGIVLKPYFNLNRDTPRERWLRIGRVLAELQRPRSLEFLCYISAKVSEGSIPVGLTIDLLPDGTSGRVKAYFRSTVSTAEWLERWYKETNNLAHARLVRRCLDVFPMLSNSIYPDGSFVVGLEFHGNDEDVSLKTDFAITKWMCSDHAILLGVKSILHELGGSVGELENLLFCTGVLPADRGGLRALRFVGLGHEPNGDSHLNIYVEPSIAHSLSTPTAHVNCSIQDAIRSAVDFLLSSCHDYHWSDFKLPAGSSDIWVTAYILARLAQVPQNLLPKRTCEVLRNCLEWLLDSQAPEGGWSYNSKVPADADSTSWGILALHRHKHAVPHSAVSFLEKCRQQSGVFGTYPVENSPFPGWTAGSPDVTAAALLAFREIGRCDSVNGFDSFDSTYGCLGLLPAYWWCSPLYTMALRLEGETSGVPRLSTVLIQTLQDFQTNNAFDTALLAYILRKLRLSCNDISLRLRGAQNKDGSWPPSALLRLTKPTIAAPWNSIASGPLFLDHNSVFTTATAIFTLCSLLD